MFELAFIIIVIVLVGNVILFVKNFKSERKAVEEKLQQGSTSVNDSAVKTTTAKSNPTNKKPSSNKKKNYSYRK